MVIAEDGVLPLQGTNYVWVVVDGKAVRRQVELGVRTPGFVEARSGVEAGEQVVVGGQERLAEGAPVAATLVDRRPAGGSETVGGRAAPGTDTVVAEAPDSEGDSSNAAR